MVVFLSIHGGRGAATIGTSPHQLEFLRLARLAGSFFTSGELLSGGARVYRVPLLYFKREPY